MGQLHIKKIELAELVRRSPIIVIAEPDDPPTVEEQVVIKARGKKPPPYIRTVDRFRVRESLRGHLAPGTAIAVAPADDALQERLHRDYYIKGLSRHVVVNRYEPMVAYAPDQSRILFLTGHGERYAFTIAGGTEGLTQRSEVENLLSLPSVAYTPGTRETIVDRALRTHGDFGEYGDLRAGLAEISNRNTVKLTEANGGYRVDIMPHDGQGHEYQFVVTLGGTIENFMAGESEPAVAAVPDALIFEFDAVQLRKQGSDISLSIVPVWRDAQRGPPPGFEQGARTLRLSPEEFADLWRDLNAMDMARYARVTDTDFETIPPDLRHTEHLRYVANGREIVQWGRSDEWLRAELRAPLLALQNELHQRVTAQAPGDPADFTRLMLRDVQGLHGGQNVYVLRDRRVIVQRVTPVETGLHEQRYEFALSEQQSKELRQLLTRHPPVNIRIPARTGIPDQARPEITHVTRDGVVTTAAKWDDNRHPDFDALYDHLLRFARQSEKIKPVWEGSYDHDWQPE